MEGWRVVERWKGVDFCIICGRTATKVLAGYTVVMEISGDTQIIRFGVKKRLFRHITTYNL